MELRTRALGDCTTSAAISGRMTVTSADSLVVDGEMPGTSGTCPRSLARADINNVVQYTSIPQSQLSARADSEDVVTHISLPQSQSSSRTGMDQGITNLENNNTCYTLSHGRPLPTSRITSTSVGDQHLYYNRHNSDVEQHRQISNNNIVTRGGDSVFRGQAPDRSSQSDMDDAHAAFGNNMNRHFQNNSRVHGINDSARLSNSDSQTIQALKNQVASLQSVLSGMESQNNRDIVCGDTNQWRDQIVGTSDSREERRVSNTLLSHRSQNPTTAHDLGYQGWNAHIPETHFYNAPHAQPARQNMSQHRYQNGHDEPKPRLPIFNGKSEWEPFWVQFQMMSIRYGWGSQKQGEQLLFSLKDEALTFAASLSVETRNNLDSFLRAMKRRFGDHVLAETHRLNLQNIKRQNRESVQEYASRVNTAMIKSYPGLADTQLFTDLTIEYLLTGLADQNLAYDVMTKKPTSLEEAIEMITWHDCCKGGTRRRTAVRQLTTDVEDDTQYMETEDVDVRRVNGQRFVTEARLQQFGRDLKEGLVKEVSAAITKDLKETIMQDVSTIITQQLENQWKKMTQVERRPQRNTDNRHRKFDMSNIECYSCREFGHYSRNCPASNSTQVKGRNETPKNRNEPEKSEN